MRIAPSPDAGPHMQGLASALASWRPPPLSWLLGAALLMSGAYLVLSDPTPAPSPAERAGPQAAQPRVPSAPSAPSAAPSLRERKVAAFAAGDAAPVGSSRP